MTTILKIHDVARSSRPRFGLSANHIKLGQTGWFPDRVNELRPGKKIFIITNEKDTLTFYDPQRDLTKPAADLTHKDLANASLRASSQQTYGVDEYTIINDKTAKKTATNVEKPVGFNPLTLLNESVTDVQLDDHGRLDVFSNGGNIVKRFFVES